MVMGDDVLSEPLSWWGIGAPGDIDVKELAGFTVLPLSPASEDTSIYARGAWHIRADATHFQGVPIECMCAADVAGGKGGGDGVVDESDLMAVLANWGSCVAPCAPFCDGDVTSASGLPDCAVDVFDLLALLEAWGSCE